MRKIFLLDRENNKVEVDLVRYFEVSNDNYLVYTLEEQDERGYIKLYVVKVMEELGCPVSLTIKDEQEWEEMQVIVKNIIKDIKAHKEESFNDLDIMPVENLKIREARSFKIDKKLVDLLSYDIDTEESTLFSPEKTHLEVEPISELTNFVELNQITENIKLDFPILLETVIPGLDNIDVTPVVSEKTSIIMPILQESIIPEVSFVVGLETKEIEKLQVPVLEETSVNQIQDDKNLVVNVSKNIEESTNIKKDYNYKNLYEDLKNKMQVLKNFIS